MVQCSLVCIGHGSRNIILKVQVGHHKYAYSTNLFLYKGLCFGKLKLFQKAEP